MVIYKKFSITRYATRFNIIIIIIIFTIYIINLIHYNNNNTNNSSNSNSYTNIINNELVLKDRYLISYVMYAPYSSKINRNVHKVCR